MVRVWVTRFGPGDQQPGYDPSLAHYPRYLHIVFSRRHRTKGRIRVFLIASQQAYSCCTCAERNEVSSALQGLPFRSRVPRPRPAPDPKNIERIGRITCTCATQTRHETPMDWKFSKFCQTKDKSRFGMRLDVFPFPAEACRRGLLGCRKECIRRAGVHFDYRRLFDLPMPKLEWNRASI